MLRGNLSPYLDTHNEDESSYVTLSNGPYVFVPDSTSTKPRNSHALVDVYFVTPILCKHCEDYVWGTGKVGVKCKGYLVFTRLEPSTSATNRAIRIIFDSGKARSAVSFAGRLRKMKRVGSKLLAAGLRKEAGGYSKREKVSGGRAADGVWT
ncbi:uncharacterized protein LOC143368746 [Andrena cerasifolii]|uniref:uncharacterized protein LOC143368746 n=1 Tax=Andrena cerasifolii TaxID=2819439 RepID=UPI004037D71F